MSRKKLFPFPSGDLLVACIQPRPFDRGAFGFCLGSPHIAAAMPTPVAGFHNGFISSWALDADPVAMLRKPCVGF